MRAWLAAAALLCAACGGAVRADATRADGAAQVKTTDTPDPTGRARDVLRNDIYQRRMPGDRAPIQPPTPKSRQRASISGTSGDRSRPMPPPLTSGESAAFEGLGWVLGGLVVAFIVPALWRAFAASRRSGRPTGEVADNANTRVPALERPAERALARQLARDGQYGDAVLVLWREALTLLHAGPDATGTWPPELTGREIASELEARGALGGERRVQLQVLLFHMEVAVFGPGVLTSDDFARCDAAFETLFGIPA